MKQHIFECPSSSSDPLAADCQCARLRACEERVRAACIAAVEATIQHDDACKSVIPGRECNCTRFDTLASLRKVQPLAQWWGEEKDWFHDPKGHWVTYADHVAAVEAMHAACIATVEEFFRMPIDEQITEWVDTYGEAEWFDQACLAALRKVQP